MRRARIEDRVRSRRRLCPGHQRWLAAVLALTLLAGSPGPAVSSQTAPAPLPAGGSGVVTVHGVTGPDIGLGTDAPPFAALTDLTAYLERDLTASLPPDGQVIAPLDVIASQPVFDLALPTQPRGRAHGFGEGAVAAVQLFSVNVHADLGGTPFLDPFEYSAWPTGYSSLRLAAGTWDIVGGRLLVWADGAEHLFPSAPGPDGLPLTGDDPLTAVEPGWTLIDLDATPFRLLRDEVVDVSIDSGFGGTRDLSAMRYVDSFDALVADLRARYPFTDLKAVDWDEIVATYRPEIVAAERAGNADAYTEAMMRLSVEIGDGHLAVTPSLAVLRDRLGGSTGLSLARTDRDQVIVTAVAEDSSAASAGIRPGATIALWDGQAPMEALAMTAIVRPVSTGPARIAQQLDLLPLGPVGSEVAIAVRNEGEISARTMTLARTEDTGRVDRLVSGDAGSVARRVEPPVTSSLIDPATGYIRVRTFAASPALIVAAWDQAIRQIEATGARSLILDLRGNPGGVVAVATYLAGSFITRPVNLADLRIATDDGEWPVSGKLIVRPNGALWTGPVAVLVDAGCISACEILAGALSANPATVIAGTDPTGGVVATVAFWLLPTGGVFQAPLGRFEQRGGPWLEGQGVAPTLDVPVTQASILSGDDTVLAAAIAALAA